MLIGDYLIIGQVWTALFALNPLPLYCKFQSKLKGKEKKVPQAFEQKFIFIKNVT